MKKIFFGAAVATMMFASCQNDMIESVEQQGRMFTLEVNQGGSRTALDGLQTVWSKGDQIYVTSEDGQTTGVLTLIGEGGEAGGKFSGFVFGNGELKYSVYPVPTKPVDLGKANVERLDAPMTGTISGGATTFNHACGFVRLNLLGIDNNDKVNIAGGQVGSVLEYDLATNTWKKKTVASKITVVEAEDAETFYVPVYVDPTTTVPIDLTITINNETVGAEMEVIPQVSKVNAEVPNFVVTEDGVKDIATANPGELGDNYIYVSTVEEMRNAIRGEEGPAYVVIKNGEYNITSGDEMEIVRNITIVGESEVILNAVTQGNGWRIFNIYGGSGSLNEEMIVTIKNIVLGDKTWTKRGLWIRNDLNGSDKNTNNGCNLTVNLENFQCYRAIVDNGEAIKNENGQMGDNITVKMKNCDIRDFNVQAWKNDKSDTYSYIEFDDASNLGIIVDKEYPLTNIFINGKNPKAHGQQTTYVVKE